MTEALPHLGTLLQGEVTPRPVEGRVGGEGAPPYKNQLGLLKDIALLFKIVDDNVRILFG